MNYLAFIFIVAHWALIITGYMGMQHGDAAYRDLYYGSFLQVSPVMLFFNVLSFFGASVHGHIYTLFFVGIIWTLLKDGSLIIAVRQNSFSLLNIVSTFMEVAYLATSGYLLFKLEIL